MNNCYGIILVFLLVACSPQATTSTFPEEEWTYQSLAEADVREDILEETLAFLEKNSFEDGIEEVVIVKGGKIVFEGDSVEKRHNIYSCSKAFTSLVMGLLAEEGRIEITDPVHKTLPELAPLYPDLTWRHFATMTSGYSGAGISRWNEENSDWSWTPYEPEEPHFAPGTHYEYWDEAQMMFGKGLTTVLQGTMYEYLDQRIMKPIGIQKWSWGTEQKLSNGTPINNGCTGVTLHAKDLARFGLLFLNEGRWGDQQLIPPNFAQQAIAVQVPVSVPLFPGERASAKGSGSYGYNWWVNSEDGLSGMPDAPMRAAYLSGLNHNICMIIPDWDMVIVRMGDDKNPIRPKYEVWNEFLGMLGEGIAL